jgi:hypothetical protein
MTEILIIGGIAGIVLGLRFKVLVLVPAVLLAAMIIIGTGIAIGQGPVTIALMVLGAVAPLQIGYLTSVLLRAMVLQSLYPGRGLETSNDKVVAQQTESPALASPDVVLDEPPPSQSPALASPDAVQPPSQPHSGVVVDEPLRLGDR